MKTAAKVSRPRLPSWPDPQSVHACLFCVPLIPPASGDVHQGKGSESEVESSGGRRGGWTPTLCGTSCLSEEMMTGAHRLIASAVFPQVFCRLQALPRRLHTEELRLLVDVKQEI